MIRERLRTRMADLKVGLYEDIGRLTSRVSIRG